MKRIQWSSRDVFIVVREDGWVEIGTTRNGSREGVVIPLKVLAAFLAVLQKADPKRRG